MKKLFFLLSLVGLSLVFTNCNKDDEDTGEDLTLEIVGDYIGAYASNSVASMNNYEIVVSKVNNSRISVRPKSGSEFSETEIDIIRVNSSSLSSNNENNQQLQRTAIFTLGIPVSTTMTIEPQGEGHSFIGSLQ